MQSKWMQRLTLGLAATALFVAAGGPTYAASKINGKNIKTRSIAGSKLKNNTITGTQVNESKLGTVPRAIDANKALDADKAKTADKAKDADTVDGVSQEEFTISKVQTGTCVVADTGTNCPAVSITLPRAGRVKIDISGGWFSASAAGSTVGASCEIRGDTSTVLSTGFLPGTTDNDTSSTKLRTFAANTVTSIVQPAGTHTYGLRCTADSGDAFELDGLRTVATMVGSS